MSYVATIPVVFPCSRAEVYRALCNLNLYPGWNKSIQSISAQGMMHEGLRYETKSRLPGGRTNVAQVEVTRMEQDREIELVNNASLIAYRAVFRLNDHPRGGTEVVCTLRFEFRNFVLDLARPAIEAMAEAQVRHDLEALRDLLTNKG